MLRRLKTIKINTLRELSLRLGVELNVLYDVARHIDLHYDKFHKRTGKKERDFYPADYSLKEIHKCIEKRILDRFDFPLSLQGGIKGRSLRTNVEPHVNKTNVGHFDIKNFFPSVRPRRIYNTFVELGCSPNVARLLTRLVTAEGQLPLGFKTSPKIAALILLNLDRRFSGFLKKYGIKHTIWVDDLTVSGGYPIKKIASGIRKIINQEGFESHKEEIVYANKRQVVTGVVVNTKPSVHKERRLEIERIIFKCEKIGIKEYITKNKQQKDIKSFIEIINGKLSNMIAIDETKYRPLYKKWQKIAASK